MELLDSRCFVCKESLYQCTQCKKEDMSRRKAARLQKQALAAAAKPVPAAEKLVPAPPLDDSDSDRDLQVSAEYARVGLAILNSTSQKRVRNLAFPAPVTAPPPATLATTSFASSAAPAKTLRDVLKAAPRNWTLPKVLRNGHCLFLSFVRAFTFLADKDLPKTQEDLREACANQLLQWEGNIPTHQTLFHEGKCLLQKYSNDKEEWVSLEQYCDLLRTNLFGGMEEIALIVQMYKLQVFLFTEDDYKGGEPEPIKVLLFPQLPENDPSNEGCPRIHLYRERTQSGKGDHWVHLVHKFALHAKLMSQMPKVNRDYRVVASEVSKNGRELESMTFFEEDELTGFYDGHRVDDKGNVIMRRERISQLMQQFPQIDREKNGTPFQTTHAVRLGSHGKSALTKRSGLMIDGGPLTHPCLDHVDGIGRMALADSAAPNKKNM